MLLVDGGDCFFPLAQAKPPARGEELRMLSTARRILKAYEHMGYDAVGLGAHDLQLGVTKLKAFLDGSRLPVVCANLVEKESGKPAFREWVVVEAGGKRFGIYGVVLDTLSPSYEKRILEDRYELVGALEATRRVVPRLRKECDVVIALSHINMDQNVRIVEDVPGIDAVVDPYSRSGTQPVFIPEGEYVAWAGKVPLLRVDGQGSRVGVCEMYFPRTGKSDEDFYIYDYPLYPHVFDHPEILRILKGEELQLDASHDPRQVRLLPELFLGAEVCGACHERQYEFWRASTHSRAYETLAKTHEELKYECIECHTLGYGISFVDPRKVGDYKAVQCENCHGIDARHAENPARYRLGPASDSKCLGCHNPHVLEQAFKDVREPFDMDEIKTSVACPKMES